MWTPLGSPNASLASARLLAHWACQPLAAAASAWNEARADDSHLSLSVGPHGLTTLPLGGSEALCVALDIAAFELRVLDCGAIVHKLELRGQPLEAALAWTAEKVATQLGKPQRDLVLPDYELPDHEVSQGRQFAAKGLEAELKDLDSWFRNCAALLEPFAARRTGASAVRAWPHHFDIATLITLQDAEDPEEARSIGVGASPGDTAYELPYLYVSPWPYPEPRLTHDALGPGHWHTDGFYAAVLELDKLVAGGPEGQGARARTFIETAHGACRRMLGYHSEPIRSDALVWFKAAELDELEDGRVKTVAAGLETVCLTRHEGCYAALQNACPHQGGPLGEGSIEKGWLRCPWHGWDFHPTTGKSPDGHDDGLETYAVEVRKDGVYVGVEPPKPHVRTVSDAMAQTMTNWGVRWVFGMVGHSNLGLADGLRREVEEDRLGYVGIRHEGAASFACSAYGKLTGRPAACLAIAGPGATNLLTGLWDANVDRSPALALTGQVDTQVLGRGAFQEIDLEAAFGQVAQFSATVLASSNHAEIMTLACKNAILNRGVSHLIFPDEVQTIPSEQAPSSPEGRMPDLQVAPSPAALQRAVERIRKAKRPLIIVGHGARFAMKEITALAETFGWPIATTFKAKGQIADTHPLGCGVLGRSGTPIASWFMNEADLLIVFGSSFSNHTGITSYQPIVQVDFEPTALGRWHPVEVPVFGEISATVELLREQLGGASFEDLRPEVAQRWAIWRKEKESRLGDARGEGLNSASIFAALTRTVPHNAIVPVDVGNNTYSFGRYFETHEQAVLMSGYLGSIGFALPAAMGCWAATQEGDPAYTGRKVVSVSGDGGLGQYLAELTTLAKYDMDVTHVLLNNGELGKISKEQRGGKWRVWETELRNPDFTAFAASCGLHAVQIRDVGKLDQALADAIAHEGPALVEIISDALLV